VAGISGLCLPGMAVPSHGLYLGIDRIIHFLNLPFANGAHITHGLHKFGFLFGLFFTQFPLREKKF